MKSGGAGQTTLDVPVDTSTGVAVNTGTLVASRGGMWAGSITTAAATVLRFNGGTHNLSGVTISGPGRAEISSGTVNTTGAVTVAAMTTLANTATLGGAGPLTVNGTLEWNAGTITGSGMCVVNEVLTLDSGSNKTLNGRTLESNGMAQWKSSGTVSLTNGAVLHNSATGTFDIQFNGFMGISGSPTTELFDNDGMLIKSGAGGVTTFDVPVTNSGTFEIKSGSIAFTRAAYVQTAGSTTLNGGNMTAQVGVGMDMQGGSLRGSGTVTGQVASAGSVSPGLSPGKLTVTGNYTQKAGGALTIEIGGLTPATEFDQLQVNGTATLGGALNVTLINGFVPVEGNQFVVLSGMTTGNFNSTNLPPLPGGLSWQVGIGSVTLTVGTGGPTPTVTSTASTTRTNTATATSTASSTRTVTATPTSMNTAATSTATSTRTATATSTPTATPASATRTATRTPTVTASKTPPPDVTATTPPVSATATATATHSRTASPTNTATATATHTATDTHTATAKGTPTATGTHTATATHTISPTPTATGSLTLTGVVWGPGPPGLPGRGLVPIVGPADLFICRSASVCLSTPGVPFITVITDSLGRFRFTLSLEILRERVFVLIQVIAEGVRCRLLLTPGRLAALAGAAGGAQVSGVGEMDLSVDPIIEAASRLLEAAGADNDDDDGIAAVIAAVEDANADTNFAGLTVAAANDRAESIAANDPTVRMVLAESRLTPTPGPACPGDCNQDGMVSVDELIKGVNIALGNAALSTCPQFDLDGGGMVEINELSAAVNAALNGCP